MIWIKIFGSLTSRWAIIARKRIFNLFKTQMMSMSKIRCMFSALKKQQFRRKQLYASFKTILRQSHSLMNAFFWRLPAQGTLVTFPRAPQAQAKKISAILVMFTWKIPFIHPSGKLGCGVPYSLIRLEWVRCPPNPTRVSMLTPSDTSRGSKPAHPRTLLHPTRAVYLYNCLQTRSRIFPPERISGF